jgi:hypothetical protein
MPAAERQRILLYSLAFMLSEFESEVITRLPDLALWLASIRCLMCLPVLG